MRILHVLSQIFASGPEFYVADLTKKHGASGHEIFVVSDSLTASVRGMFFGRPIANRRYLQRLKNIWYLRKFIKDRGIDLVHAHSRAASWVCHFATLGTRVPLVSTVHGRQFPHISARLLDVYGFRVITVCENLREHLVNEMKMEPGKIVLIRNGFDFSDLRREGDARRDGTSAHTRNQGEAIAIVGRTNGPKGENTVRVIEDVIGPLLAERDDLRAYLIGGAAGELPGDGYESVKSISIGSGRRLEMLGFVDDLPEWIARSDLVICSGRVAVEALCMEKPVVAVGEDVSHGLVTDVNLNEAMASNFGDVLPTSERETPDLDLIRTHVRRVLTGAITVDSLRSNILREYDGEAVSRDVMRVYESARMKKLHPRHIPVLMYHKIPDKPFQTEHGVYITRENFRRHLEYFRRRGFTTITFREYEEFSRGRRDMSEFPGRPVILTFDDGYHDNFVNLLPMMQEFGFKGVMFLLGDASADYNFWDADRGDHYDALMTLGQKKAFVDAGWEIGAHSMTHPDLCAMDYDQATWEMDESKRRLEADLATEVISFAYPGGSVDERVKRLTRKAGYTFGISTDTGGLHIEDDRLQVFRVNMFPQDGWFQVWKKSSHWYRRYYRWKRKK